MPNLPGEDQAKFKRLLQQFVGTGSAGFRKELTLELGIDKSTLSRWLDEKSKYHMKTIEAKKAIKFLVRKRILTEPEHVVQLLVLGGFANFLTMEWESDEDLGVLHIYNPRELYKHVQCQLVLESKIIINNGSKESAAALPDFGEQTDKLLTYIEYQREINPLEKISKNLTSSAPLPNISKQPDNPETDESETDKSETDKKKQIQFWDSIKGYVPSKVHTFVKKFLNPYLNKRELSTVAKFAKTTTAMAAIRWLRNERLELIAQLVNIEHVQEGEPQPVKFKGVTRTLLNFSSRSDKDTERNKEIVITEELKTALKQSIQIYKSIEIVLAKAMDIMEWYAIECSQDTNQNAIIAILERYP